MDSCNTLLSLTVTEILLAPHLRTIVGFYGRRSHAEVQCQASCSPNYETCEPLPTSHECQFSFETGPSNTCASPCRVPNSPQYELSYKCRAPLPCSNHLGLCRRRMLFR